MRERDFTEQSIPDQSDEDESRADKELGASGSARGVGWSGNYGGIWQRLGACGSVQECLERLGCPECPQSLECLGCPECLECPQMSRVSTPSRVSRVFTASRVSTVSRVSTDEHCV